MIYTIIFIFFYLISYVIIKVIFLRDVTPSYSIVGTKRSVQLSIEMIKLLLTYSTVLTSFSVSLNGDITLFGRVSNKTMQGSSSVRASLMDLTLSLYYIH